LPIGGMNYPIVVPLYYLNLIQNEIVMASCQSTTDRGKRLTGCMSAFSNSVLILFQKCL
jgi:hypothetical protein